MRDPAPRFQPEFAAAFAKRDRSPALESAIDQQVDSGDE
jgi:hypothetical protein